MAQAKKLQVFVSSTYTDLQEERQAAVQAILNAGHIPAGMELFAAGDESQMQVIRRWIDESDVFMLILGGRYGSLEPTSQKSYIHLEYEYALEKDKPLFAVVIEEEHLERKAKEQGLDVVERDHTQKLKAFREFVLTKMVHFWDDPRDIEIAVHRTVADFGRRDDLAGWVPGDQVRDTGPLAAQLARLAEENAELREQLEKSKSSPEMYGGLTFQQLHNYLAATGVDPEARLYSHVVAEDGGGPDSRRQSVDLLEAKEPTLLGLLWFWRGILAAGLPVQYASAYDRAYAELLMQLELVGKVEDGSAYMLTSSGRRFLVRLVAEGYSGGA